MESNVQAPNDQQSETNQLPNQSRSSEKPESASEEKEKLFQEKAQLVERGKEIRNLASDLLQENIRLHHERNLQEKAFINFEKNPIRMAEVIRSRLLYVHDLCNKREKVFKQYFDCFTKRYDETALNNHDKILLQRKQMELDDMYFVFNEQFETIELLMETDYNETCRENPNCFVEVMKECNFVEESCYNLTSFILEE